MLIAENVANAATMREAIVARHNGTGDPSTSRPVQAPVQVVRVAQLPPAPRRAKASGSPHRVIVHKVRVVAAVSIVAREARVAISKVANVMKAAVNSLIAVPISVRISSRPVIRKTQALPRW